ncbi:unnamed protein product [Leuciscus chuanchicus]
MERKTSSRRASEGLEGCDVTPRRDGEFSITLGRRGDLRPAGFSLLFSFSCFQMSFMKATAAPPAPTDSWAGPTVTVRVREDGWEEEARSGRQEAPSVTRIPRVRNLHILPEDEGRGAAHPLRSKEGGHLVVVGWKEERTSWRLQGRGESPSGGDGEDGGEDPA